MFRIAPSTRLLCLLTLALTLGITAVASAQAVRPAAARGAVVTFRLPSVTPDRVAGASLTTGRRSQRVAVRKVRKALSTGHVLSVRSKLRTRKVRLLMRLRSTGTRPETSITAGPTGTVDSTSATLRFTSPTSGATFECRLDAGSWARCTSPKALSGLRAGEHVFEVRARTKSGLADATAAKRTWTVRGAAPTGTTSTVTRPATTTAPASGGLTDRPAPVGAGELLRDDFSGPDGLITNAFAYWAPDDDSAARSSIWENETATLFRRGNTGWSGVPDGREVDRLSANGTGSQVYRLWTKRADFGNVLVRMRLLNEAYSNGDANWPVKSWDGVKLWLRRGGRTGSFNLYTAEVNRRQGNVMLQKKCAGSDEYTILAQSASNQPALVGQWEDVGGSVRTNPDGSVTVQLIRGGRVVLEATDRGEGGCAPITAPGRVGIRADNVQFSVDDFVVSAL